MRLWIWTFLWNYNYICKLKELYLMSLQGELKPVAIQLKKLLYAIDDPYSLRVVQIHLKFEHFFKILSILVISKKSVQYHCRWNLKQYAIKLKITQCDRWPIFTPRWTKDFEFGHVIANITITLISLKISRYYRSSNSKHCGSNWDFEFQHFSEIISISWISKKIYLIIIEVAT